MLATRSVTVIFALAVAVGAANAALQQRPVWITDAALTQLRSIGIEPESDLTDRGNYHWRWVSRRTLVVDHYRCPPGSSVDVSRTITVVGAPAGAVCRDARGSEAESLKLYSDGSAEPLS
jgi:hypothetical protein